MDQNQIEETLKTLAHYVVRNEIVTEHFLRSLGVPMGELGAKVREIDQHLKDHTDWQNRFPNLFRTA